MTLALITGGNRGLGKSMALHLAAAGADIIFTYRSNKTEADAVVAEIECLGRKVRALPLDVGVSKSFDAFVGEVKALLPALNHKALDILVNNAGMGVHAAFESTTEAEFDELANVHVKGPFFLTQKLLPIVADGGRILNVSSGLARFSLPGYAVYAAMKGAIEVLTRYMAKELGARGITVNVLAPGAIATDFGHGRVRDDADINAYIAAQIPLGRVGEADDIGGVAVELLMGKTRWINGQRIEASGGMFL